MSKKNGSYSNVFIFKRLLRYLKKDRWEIFLLLFFIFCENTSLTIAPMLIKNITNTLQEVAGSGGDKMSEVISLLILLSLLYIFGNLCLWLDNILSVKLTQIILRGLREKLQKKLNKISISYLDSHPVGEILSIYTNDMNSLSTTLSGTIIKILGQVITVAGVITAMLIMDVRLTFVYIVMLVITYFVMNIISKKMKPMFKNQQNIVGTLNGCVNDMISNHQIITAYGYEERAKESFEIHNKEFFRSYVESRFVSGFIAPVTKLISNLAYISLCLISAVLIMQGNLTLGELMAFIIYANMLSSPILTLANNINGVQLGMAAAERILTLIDTEDIEKENPVAFLEADNVAGNVEFDHVTFRYEEDTPLMEDVSFEVSKGQMIAIVGPSGAGKTTVINLLMRFYDVNSGKIKVDGVDINDLSRNNLRQMFGLVLQDAWIFGGTVRENIAFGRPDAGNEEIEEAAAVCGCDSFIRKLPQGYDTVIDEDHCSLSAGEKQLLTIARVYLADPVILILDEATSQVDIKTEVAITQAMNKLMKNRTCFVIAHRLFTIKNADKIMYMEKGNIKEIGSHSELMEKDGLYAAMYKAMQQ